MNILFCCNDNKLLEGLNNIDNLDTLNVVSSISDFKDDVENLNTNDLIIVSDKIVDYNTFITLLDAFSIKSEYIYYLISSSDKNIPLMIEILESKGIKIIAPKTTVAVMLDNILSAITKKNALSNNIVTFFGADDKVGTTMVTQCIAECLAENSDKSICVFNTNFGSGSEYITKTPISIDSIKNKIKNKIITTNEIKDLIVSNKGVDYLSGSNNLFEVRHYHIEDIELVIRHLSKMYDVVFIDAGNDFDLATGITPLRITNNIYLVGTQQPKVIEKYNTIKSQLFSRLKLDTVSFKLIVNKYIDDAIFENITTLSNKYKGVLAGCISFNEYFRQVEIDKCSFYSLGKPVFNNSILNLCKIVSSSLGIKLKENNVISKRKLMFFRKTVLEGA